MSAAEIARLGDTLAEAEREGTAHPSAILSVRLLLLTGARKSEILNLRWDEIDFERACIWLSESKTGEKVIPLGAPALDLLQHAQRVERNPFVCFGNRPGARLVGLQKIWERLRI